MRRVQLRGGARWEATRGVRASGECGAVSGPRRRKFVGPIVSRVTWHGGRGRQRSRWALLFALPSADGELLRVDAPQRMPAQEAEQAAVVPGGRRGPAGQDTHAARDVVLHGLLEEP